MKRERDVTETASGARAPMMQIGDLALRAGTTTRTIRYYEELGIIEPEERSEGGFRLYSEDQLRLLTIVQGLKSLGFDLERIHGLLALRTSLGTGGELAEAMARMLADQQREIKQKIEQYQEVKRRNDQALEMLQGCLGCSVGLPDRNCPNCQAYREQPDVPEGLARAMYAE